MQVAAHVQRVIGLDLGDQACGALGLLQTTRDVLSGGAFPLPGNPSTKMSLVRCLAVWPAYTCMLTIGPRPEVTAARSVAVWSEGLFCRAPGDAWFIYPSSPAGQGLPRPRCQRTHSAGAVLGIRHSGLNRAKVSCSNIAING